MKTQLIILTLTLGIVSCGKNVETIVKEIPVEVVKEVEKTPEPTSEEQDVLNLIQDENDYRDIRGQSMLSRGLSCSLKTFTSGTRIQATSGGNVTFGGLSTVATFTLDKVINQERSDSSLGMNLLPSSLMSLYKTNYLLSCSGFIVVTDSDNVSFELTSDDASLLYLNDAKLIDNDNSHGITVKSASKFLRRGVHSFKFSYAQNSGEQAFILKMNGELINPVNLVK